MTIRSLSEKFEGQYEKIEVYKTFFPDSEHDYGNLIYVNNYDDNTEAIFYRLLRKKEYISFVEDYYSEPINELWKAWGLNDTDKILLIIIPYMSVI